eukprot:7911093-Heterocapsa_arctica.AAC.1
MKDVIISKVKILRKPKLDIAKLIDKAASKQKGKAKKQDYFMKKKIICPKPDSCCRVPNMGSVRPRAGARGPYNWHPD